MVALARRHVHLPFVLTDLVRELALVTKVASPTLGALLAPAPTLPALGLPVPQHVLVLVETTGQTVAETGKQYQVETGKQ